MFWKKLAEMSHALCLWGILTKDINFGVYCLLSLYNNIIKRCLQVQRNEAILFNYVLSQNYSLISRLANRLREMRFTVTPNHTVQRFRQLQANSREPNTHVMISTCRSPFGWCNTANCEPRMEHKHQTKAQACMPQPGQQKQMWRAPKISWRSFLACKHSSVSDRQVESVILS